MSETLRIESLWKKFGRKSVLEELGFSLAPGEVCGLLGRNGEGKTTLIRILMGIIPQDRGEILFQGLPIGRGASAYKNEIGYIPEDPFFYGWMRVKSFLDFNASFYPRWDPERIRGLLDDLSLDPKTRIRDMSRGEKLKLALTAALGASPRLLILDDPTSGLDVPTRHDFLRDLIRELSERGTAVLFATHLIHELERVADRLLVLHGRRIILDRNLEDVKGRMRRVRLHLEPETTELPALGGAGTWLRVGSRFEAVIYPWDREAEDTLRNLSPKRLEIEPLSLEEIFVHLVTPGETQPESRP